MFWKGGGERVASMSEGCLDISEGESRVIEGGMWCNRRGKGWRLMRWTTRVGSSSGCCMRSEAFEPVIKNITGYEVYIL